MYYTVVLELLVLAVTLILTCDFNMEKVRYRAYPFGLVISFHLVLAYANRPSFNFQAVYLVSASLLHRSNRGVCVIFIGIRFSDLSLG